MKNIHEETFGKKYFLFLWFLIFNNDLILYFRAIHGKENYLEFNFSIFHLLRRPEKVIHVIPENVDENNKDRNGEKSVKPEKTILREQLITSLVVFVQIDWELWNDSQISKHTTYGEQHDKSLYPRPLMVQKHDLQLQWVTCSNKYSCSHWKQSIWLEWFLHYIIKEQTYHCSIQ